MILSGLGLQLKRIEQKDLELIRTWRNSKHVNEQMFFQDNISSKQQKIWFEGINNASNYYFLILDNGLPRGLIYAKDVDESTLCGEGGIFIGDPAHMSSDLAGRAACLLLVFCFKFLKVTSSKISVKSTNIWALNFNDYLGYKSTRVNGDKIEMAMDSKDFEGSAAFKLMNKRWGPDFMHVVLLTGEDSVLNHPIINDFLRKTK